jgi:CBS domain-containing protein
MTIVKEIMTRNVMTVSPDDLATKARSIIRQHGYSALPVMEKDKLVGIVSRGDILRITSNKTNITVAGIMNSNPETVPVNEDVFNAAKLLLKSRIGQVIVAENGTLKGIVSSIDILKRFRREGYHPIKKKVEDLMIKNPKRAQPEEEVSAIVDMMYSDHWNGLPVVKDNKVIGVVTRIDLFGKDARISKESGKARTTRIENIMRTPTATVNPETSTEEAGKLMTEKGIIMLPVVGKKGELLGVVNIENVIAAYIS